MIFYYIVINNKKGIQSSLNQAKKDKERKTRAKRESAAAPKKDTLAARKIQNRLGVKGAKLGRGKKKAACPLIKTELNGAFNNLLDNFQSLYD